MATKPTANDPVGAIALLAEPQRRRLYELVSGRADAVGRDEAAEALGISRELAAFHLDRLVDGQLLSTEYRRLSGRRGPGAGRPAKLYRRADREVAVSIPARRYDVAARQFAEALGRLTGSQAIDAVREVAHQRGREDGAEARRAAGPRPSGRRLRNALMALLGHAGYEPEADPDAGTISLRNCPYHALVSDHRELTCGMNLAWAEGIVSELPGSRLKPELAPSPERCCVVFQPAASPPAAMPTATGKTQAPERPRT